MDRATVLEQLIEVAVDVLGVDPGIVSETSSFKEDLDADSLDLVEVVMALEERFSISVPEDKLDGITTVAEAVDLVLGIAAGQDGADQPKAAAKPNADRPNADKPNADKADKADNAGKTDKADMVGTGASADHAEPAASADRA